MVIFHSFLYVYQRVLWNEPWKQFPCTRIAGHTFLYRPSLGGQVIADSDLWSYPQIIQITHMLHGDGIFTKIYKLNDPVM